MKTARIIGMLMILGMVFSLVNKIPAQQDTTKGKMIFIIKTDILLPPLAILSNLSNLNNKYNSYIGSLTFETGFTKRHSIQLTGLLLTNPNQYDLLIIPEYKYFLSNKNPYSGFYCGAFLNYIQLKDSRENGSPRYLFVEKDYGIGEGAIVGYQRYFFKRLVIDFLIGIGEDQIIHRSRNYYDPYNGGNNFIAWRAALNIGYKF